MPADSQVPFVPTVLFQLWQVCKVLGFNGHPSKSKINVKIKETSRFQTSTKQWLWGPRKGFWSGLSTTVTELSSLYFPGGIGEVFVWPYDLSSISSPHVKKWMWPWSPVTSAQGVGPHGLQVQVRVPVRDLLKRYGTYFTAKWDLTGSAGEKQGLPSSKWTWKYVYVLCMNQLLWSMYVYTVNGIKSEWIWSENVSACSLNAGISV